MNALEIRRLRFMAASGAARAIRERARLSLREVADHIEVRPSTIMRWERGSQRPRGERAERYLRLLDELAG